MLFLTAVVLIVAVIVFAVRFATAKKEEDDHH
jgi:hypothetical protein